MKIIVLKQGVHERKFKDKDKIIFNPISSTTVYIEGQNKYIIDPGHPAFAHEMIDALAKEGVKPEEIDYVINTHSHLDHSLNNRSFKNAEIIRKDQEDIIAWSQDKPKVCIYLDDNEIPFDEIKIIKTPGHLLNHLSVLVEIDGKKHIIAGDAIQEDNIKNGSAKPPSKEYIDSAKKIVDMADVIIPGHGRILEGESLEELKQAIYKLEVK